MTTTSRPFATLRRLLPGKRGERCELCGAGVGADHRHLLEIESRRLFCTCQACSILFEHRGAVRYRRVGRRVLALRDFQLTDAEWESLYIPIGLAFFVRSSREGKVQAFYPGPAGTTESLLTLEAWEEIASRNTVLRDLEPDVEALLVYRVGQARSYYVVPIDRCYHLAGLIRLHWHGLSGGEVVWQEIARFFAQLEEAGDA